jgi:hypothetical protein
VYVLASVYMCKCIVYLNMFRCACVRMPVVQRCYSGVIIVLQWCHSYVRAYSQAKEKKINTAYTHFKHTQKTGQNEKGV